MIIIVGETGSGKTTQIPQARMAAACVRRQPRAWGRPLKLLGQQAGRGWGCPDSQRRRAVVCNVPGAAKAPCVL